MSSVDIERGAPGAGIACYRCVEVHGAGNHGVFYLAACPERLSTNCCEGEDAMSPSWMSRGQR